MYTRHACKHYFSSKSVINRKWDSFTCYTWMYIMQDVGCILHSSKEIIIHLLSARILLIQFYCSFVTNIIAKCYNLGPVKIADLIIIIEGYEE